MRISAPAIVLLLSYTPFALATSALAPSTVAELTKYADLAVQGTVESIRSTMEDQRIFTYIDVRVSETLKGRAESPIVTLKLYGGTHDGLTTIVMGAPCFREREEVVVLLKALGRSTYAVVNLAEGKFSVERNGKGPPVVRRRLGGIAYRHGPPERDPETLDALKAAVRASRRQ